jgi:transcriptional regulator with XRE-family HTH domain
LTFAKYDAVVLVESSIFVLQTCNMTFEPYAQPMSFGDRLLQLRKAKGLTQTDLGRGLGLNGEDIGKQVVWGWEKNAHYPRLDQFSKLCERLGCTADFLLFGREVPIGVSTELLELSTIADALPPPERAKLFFLWKELASVYQQRNGNSQPSNQVNQKK